MCPMMQPLRCVSRSYAGHRLCWRARSRPVRASLHVQLTGIILGHGPRLAVRGFLVRLGSSQVTTPRTLLAFSLTAFGSTLRTLLDRSLAAPHPTLSGLLAIASVASPLAAGRSSPASASSSPGATRITCPAPRLCDIAKPGTPAT